MSTPELVRVTIDEREVHVAKGTGLVETALGAGIEIPVFCYEPRLGEPIGACRMCLVEIEGMPKLQAGCTLTAQDGMVVRTARTSAKAAEGQNSTLEFILVNHPLDCPVCDKGGECPLQDLTFRYGPGSTRMTFSTRTMEKPIPISPTIALDRERCILCYRCTRFSEDVAEDGQLVARERGSSSYIATFQDRPYKAPFSGNVIELCPVGALTSTQYRFEARPWEIQNVPSVCGLCPVGCNITATTREGKVKRILSRNHPEIDEGWLCDKGRFGYAHLYAEDRVRDPLRKIGKRRFEELSWDDALDQAEQKLRSGPVLLALSGSETVEEAQALAKLVRRGLGSDAVVLPEQTAPELDAYRAPLSAIRDADLVVVIGDHPVEERAPVVELWIRAARRNGVEVITVGVAGTVQAAPGTAADVVREQVGKQVRDAQRAVLIWSGPGGRGGTVVAQLAGELGAHAAFYLPATPNGRAVTEAWAAEGEGGPVAMRGEIGVLLISGEEAVSDPQIRALALRAKAVVAITMFSEPARGFADLVLPGTSYLERDGTIVNLEGRPQRLRRAVIPAAPDEIAWIAKLAERFGVPIDPNEEQAQLPPRPEPTALLTPPAPEREPAQRRRTPLHLVRYRSLFSGPAVERVEELQFQRPDAEIAISPRDASLRGIATGDTVDVRSNGTSLQLRARIDKRLVEGTVRAPEEHVRGLDQGVEVKKQL